ncbi:MAG: putative DNA modification/repair radical SAM protein [Clostridiales Family XIII bacterium]|jgi:putative DNA modification/repair radical SAM protein|nr:putative DNA modification/repair radical SAM protein [Clostridiales Family XIII bacterium]
MDGILFEKLRILSDGAKYDVSCATSGVDRTNVGRVGNACAAGICHSWTADGRCVGLLKVLLTNRCVYDCKYCVNRRSADTRRAAFEPSELAELTMEFYRRNYIEGLFLSSAVEVSPDDTAEKIFRCLHILREEHLFAGYIHAKIIPGVSPELLTRIGMVADRLSVNVELPSEESLRLLAPQKKPNGVFGPMKRISLTLAEQKTLKGPGLMDRMGPPGANVAAGDGCLAELMRGQNPVAAPRGRYRERFAPGGQSTQMIIGASPESDRQIIKTSESLYRIFKLKRVYFSAYIPVSDAPELPARFSPPPLLREHRLYQADWLLRFYGFAADEILDEAHPFLDADMDPKIGWALRHIEQFPVEINKAPPELLLRIPGVGSVSALRIARQRRISAVKYDDLKKMGVVLKRARFFITCSGKYYGGKDPDPVYIKNLVLQASDIRESLTDGKASPQISMFDGGFPLPIAPSAAPPAARNATAAPAGITASTSGYSAAPAAIAAPPPASDTPAAFAAAPRLPEIRRS